MIQILLVHATSIIGGPPLTKTAECIHLTQLYRKCMSVTLMSNWLKFGKIVPFGGLRPQPTTLPTVAVACSHPLRPHWAMRSTYSYLKHLICKFQIQNIVRMQNCPNITILNSLVFLSINLFVFFSFCLF